MTQSESSRRKRITAIIIAIIFIISMAPQTHAASNMTTSPMKGVTAETKSAHSIAISWTPKDGADGYKIYRYSKKKHKYVCIMDVEAYCGLVGGAWSNHLKPKTTYYYKVRAYQLTGKNTYRFTEYSRKVHATTKALVTKMSNSKVTGVKTNIIDNNTVKISWNKKARASGYKIYRSTSKNGKYTLVKTIKNKSTTHWNHTNIKEEQKYYYKVKAYQKYSKGRKTRYTQYSRKVYTYIRSPFRDESIQIQHNGATISWNKVKGADGYKIYQAFTSDEAKDEQFVLAETIKGGDTSCYTPSSPETRWYRVKAYKKVNGKTLLVGPSNRVVINKTS